MFDVDLARQLKINPRTVAGERRRRNIPPVVYHAPIDWTDEMIAQLGTQSDSSVGRALGISGSAVRSKRRALHIDPAEPVRARRRTSPPFWTAQRDALLGTDSDLKIADRLGISQYQVTGRRKKLAIAPANPQQKIDWTPIYPLLGQQTDQSLAEKFNVSYKSVCLRRRKLKIAPFQAERRTIVRSSAIKRLLLKPTREIVGVSSSHVRNLRKELNVPTPARVTVWAPEILARLGKEADAKIAEEMGLSRHTVRMKRCQQQRYIRPPWRRWSPEDDALLLSIPDNHEAAQRLDRGVRAVQRRRFILTRRLWD